MATDRVFQIFTISAIMNRSEPNMMQKCERKLERPCLWSGNLGSYPNSKKI